MAQAVPGDVPAAVLLAERHDGREVLAGRSGASERSRARYADQHHGDRAQSRGHDEPPTGERGPGGVTNGVTPSAVWQLRKAQNPMRHGDNIGPESQVPHRSAKPFTPVQFRPWPPLPFQEHSGFAGTSRPRHGCESGESGESSVDLRSHKARHSAGAQHRLVTQGQPAPALIILLRGAYRSGRRSTASRRHSNRHSRGGG